MDLHHRIVTRVKLRELRVLLVVVQQGSLAKAAEKLAMSQPAVSKAVAELEHALGARMLDRLARGVEPTMEGRVVVEHARTVFDELRRTAEELEAIADPSGGDLQVGTSAALAAGLLPRVLELLHERRPGIRFHVLEAEREVLFRELRARTLDLALTRIPSPESHPELLFEPLFDEHLFVVCGPSHPLARRKRVTPEDLVGQQWIHPTAGIVLDSIVKSAFEAMRLRFPPPTVTTTSVSLRFELLGSGGFLTILAGSMLHFSHFRDRLVALPIELPSSGVTGVTTLRERSLSPIGRLFIDCLREQTKPLRSALRR